MTTEPVAKPNGPTRSTEDTGLTTIDKSSSELAPTGAAAEKQFEIQSAIVIARRFPRNEDAAFAKLMKACGRTSFADDASYDFPRGGQDVSGPSVNLAREAARVWGNIRYGLDIVRDDAGSRQIRGWAWDLETNVKVTAEDDFKKLIFRKKGGWVEPDERDLRELTNRRGAILVRNCLLQLLPKDLIEDARGACEVTLKDEVKKDPDAARKRIILSFAGLNVTPEMLEAYLKLPLAQASPDQIAKLRQVYASIKDGNSTWGDYVAPKPPEGSKPGNLDDFAKPTAPAATAPAEQPATAAATNPTGVPEVVLISEDRAKALRALGEEHGVDADQVAADLSGSGLLSTPAAFDLAIVRAIERQSKKKPAGRK